MKKCFPYIEPTIRTIAGSLMTIAAIILFITTPHRHLQYSLPSFGVLFFVSLNLMQSGFTRFCLMERILKYFGFRSELDEIRDLNNQARIHLETLNHLNEAIVEISPSLQVVATQPLASILDVCYPMPDTDGKVHLTLEQLVAADDLSMMRDIIDDMLYGNNEIINTRFRINSQDESAKWVDCKLIHDKGEHAIHGILRDVTESHLQEMQIAHMALHDNLTGLPNRALLDDRMQQAMYTACREKSKLAVLFIDLDNFKHVNDIFGHKAGDQLLVEVSESLRAHLRRTDTVARWGGDEFVVLLPDVVSLHDVRTIAETLIEKLCEQLKTEHPSYHVTASIGASLYPTDAESVENLLIQADKALFFAKSQGRNNVQLFSEISTRNELGFKDVDFTSRFTSAVQKCLIQVHYQPIVDAHNHVPVGMEALARWYDDDYGWVSPVNFIPLAENLGLIRQLGQQVLEQALEQFIKCDLDSLGNIFLSINISNRQLEDGDFVADLIELRQRFGIKPKQVKLEITEGIALLGIERAREYLERLSENGFVISLDDFGTGYSALAYLHQLPVDEIKIDKSFVQRLHTVPGRIMVKTIVDLAHSMAMNVVAEGVEDDQQAEILTAMGVDMLQGFLFRRPGPKEDCIAYVESCKYSSGACKNDLHDRPGLIP